MKNIYQNLKTSGIPFLLFLFVIFLWTSGFVQAQTGTDTDKTYSPRFVVPDSTVDLEKLPLKSTEVDVFISGVIADVTVKQTYINTGLKPIEASYIFPASVNAAVYAMKMELGNRILIAEIKEKEEAQKLYDEAKEDGKTVSLLEQQRPNVFQMHVANILPGDTIDIELKYTELLVPKDARYEFVYPTVVGPRYTAKAGEEWTEGPYTLEGELPQSAFHIDITINAGMQVKELDCSSHPNAITQIGAYQTARCRLPIDDLYSGNKDFILHYRLAGDKINTGLLLFEDEDESYFLAMIQPPERPIDADIPPREYVFIMDVSGSMSGFPLEVSKELLTNLLNDLRPEDRFNILFFAGGSKVFKPQSVMASEANIQSAITMLNGMDGGGGTEMLNAIKTAIAMPGTEGFSRSFIIATDGYVSFDREVINYLQTHLSEANFFPFGIGSSVNRYIIEGMAHAGMSEPFIATNLEDATAMASLFKKYIDAPVLTNIEVEFDGFITKDVSPQETPDVFAERPIILFGKYDGKEQGSIEITGTSGSENYYKKILVTGVKSSKENEALKYLWARNKIQMLDDYMSFGYWEEDQEELKQQIIDLGLKYNLLTKYTSFIAIDSLIRCNDCSLTSVDQPIPLPEGVGNEAVGDYFAGATTLSNTVPSYASKGYSGSGNNPPSPKTYISAVYPNPVSENSVINIYVDGSERFMSKEIKIFDSLGRCIASIEIPAGIVGSYQVPLNMAKYNASTGVYYIYLMKDGRWSDKTTIIYNNNPQ